MLTRAQYLSGDTTQGAVLAGQVQAVKGSESITIDTTGVARVDWVSSLGLGLTVDGTFVKVALPSLGLPPSPGGGRLQAVDGSLYWDNNLASLFLRYSNGGQPVWVQVGSSYSGATSSITGVFGINGISGGGSTGNVTLSNTGILTVTAGGGIGVTAGQNPTISNTGVLAVTAGSAIAISGANTNRTIALAITPLPALP